MEVTNIWVALKRDGRPMWRIASQAGVNPGTLSRYAHGHKVPSPSHLTNIAMALSVEPDSLLGCITLHDPEAVNGSLSATG